MVCCGTFCAERSTCNSGCMEALANEHFLVVFCMIDVWQQQAVANVCMSRKKRKIIRWQNSLADEMNIFWISAGMDGVDFVYPDEVDPSKRERPRPPAHNTRHLREASSEAEVSRVYDDPASEPNDTTVCLNSFILFARPPMKEERKKEGERF